MPIPQYSMKEYANRLCDGVEAYEYPAVTYDFPVPDDNSILYHPSNEKNPYEYIFESARKGCHLDMSRVETLIRCQLLSGNLLDVKNGLSNVLYWGYATQGIQAFRVGGFREQIGDDQLLKFSDKVKTLRGPGLVDIERIEMPEFSRMPFVSKIRMFLDPDSYPVLDTQIAKITKLAHFPPFEPVGIQAIIGGIGPTSERRYASWASWCREVAKAVNAYPHSPTKGLRAVDIERAIYQIAKSDKEKAKRLLQGPKTNH